MQSVSETTVEFSVKPAAELTKLKQWQLALSTCSVHEPRAFLGRHPFDRDHDVVRFYFPDAVRVELAVGCEPTNQVAFAEVEGLYAFLIPQTLDRYSAQVHWGGGVAQSVIDPYSLPLVAGELDQHLFAEGTHRRLFEVMGCTHAKVGELDVVRFVVWAPNACAVSLVGDMNAWDARRHPMESRGASGLWELSLVEAHPGQSYKFHIQTEQSSQGFLKADPYAAQAEFRPKTGSVIPARSHLTDKAADQVRRMDYDKPMSIYEVHLGSWRKHDGWRFYSYEDLAEQLVGYAAWMGFTHIELLPIHEHPFDGSWGYQPTGLYAATARYGDPQDLKTLVRAAHAKGLGVILDWVPAHFPKDQHALARFDGTALYEHEDPMLGEHPDWGTLIYNFGRPEVRAFLISNAAMWFELYGIDGLRVDAVASMLYLDYSREDGQWKPNAFGGRENLEAVRFLRELNREMYARYPHAAIIAEESTAWPGVSRPLAEGEIENLPAVGPLGFGYKWNMGWMNDSLRYLAKDPVYRKYDHGLITFSFQYAFDENFILPISHDEVVHGKGSMLKRAGQASGGDDWQRFANLRAFYGLMWGHPGKKLLFMGQELAAPFEWSADDPLDWSLEQEAPHRQVQHYVRHLNECYTRYPALFERDCDPAGFAVLEGGDAEQSVLAFQRWSKDRTQAVIVISNLTPVPRKYRAGVPAAGNWQIVQNGDDLRWGGSGYGQDQQLTAQPGDYQNNPYSVDLDLPPLATLYLALRDEQAQK